MSRNTKQGALCVFLALVLLAASVPFGAGASEAIFVNDGESYLQGELSDAYAIGTGSATRMGNTYAYAITGTGIQMIGSKPAPGGLGVTGELKLAYSKVRVGLYYNNGSANSVRNSTLDYANLANVVGSGYNFGYYNASRQFVQIGYTATTAITMATDLNLNIDNGHLGCYHILLPATYPNFEQASAAAAAYTDGFPAYYNDVFRVLVGNYDSSGAASSAATSRGISGTAFSASSKCVVVARTSDAKILFEFDCGSSKNLAVEPISTSGKALTLFKNYKYYGGFEYFRFTGEKLTVANMVDIEDYVKGVIPYEMSTSWPVETQKAGALCARTFAACHFGYYSGTYGVDVSNDTYCQVYRGTNTSTSVSDGAVDATAGIYITYEGSPISAMYMSSSGGGTENSENVTGGYVGYLRGKVDPYEAAADSVNSRSSWTYTISATDLTAKARNYGKSVSNVYSVDVTLSETGNAIKLTLNGVQGDSVSFEKNACYSFSTSYLGLPSIHYTVTKSGSNYVFTGGGWGHNLGLSQWGSYAMGKHYGFTYDQIIAFYYTGVALARGIYS